MKKKVLLILSSLLVTLGITGCGSSLEQYAITHYPAEIEDRAKANKVYVGILKDFGAITDELYIEICENIDNQVNLYLKDIGTQNEDGTYTVDTSVVANINGAVSAYKLAAPDTVVIIDDDGKSQNYTVETSDDSSVSGAVFDATSNITGTTSTLSAEDKASLKKWDVIGSINKDASLDDLNYSYFVISNYLCSTQFKRKNTLGETNSRPKVGVWSTAGIEKKSGSTNGELQNKGSDVSVTPINFLSAEDGATINEVLKAEVYVLDASKIQEDGNSIDKVMAAIESAVSNNDVAALSNYFSPAYDSNGKTIKLMGDDFSVYTESKMNPIVFGEAKKDEPGYDLVVSQILDGKSQDVLTIRFTEFNAEAIEELQTKVGLNAEKYYFSNGGSGYKAFLLEYPVSVIESFEKTTIDDSTYIKANLTTESGLGINLKTGNIIKYDSDGNGGWLPSGIEITTSDNYITTHFADTSDTAGLSSFAAKGIAKYTIPVGGSSSGNKTAYGPQIVLRDYLEATWAPGSTSYDENLVVFGRKIRFFTGNNYWKSIGTYTLGEKTYDKLTLMYKLSNSSDVACFVDTNGKEVGTLTKLKITDFCDIGSLTESNAKIAQAETMIHYSDSNTLNNYYRVENTISYLDNIIGLNGKFTENDIIVLTQCFGGDWVTSEISIEVDKSTAEAYIQKKLKAKRDELKTVLKGIKEEDSSKVTSSNWGGYIVKSFSDLSKQSTLTFTNIENESSPAITELASTNNVNKIVATSMFPGSSIGKVDYDNDDTDVLRFYCVATTKGIFDSALYSDWINSTSSTASLEWWNSYLADHGFSYTVGHDLVNEYLQSNFQYELSQSGVVILDLETISKIQKIFDEQSNDDRVSFLRTLFVVVGIFVIAYSMILMLCWVIDTHADMGISLLTKATFGNWIAVKSEDDAPDYRTGDKTYVTGGSMLIKCIIMIAVAIVCIRVNVSEVVLVLIQKFGKIASYIEDMVQGFR